MKIRSLELFPVAPRWLFLKVTTESGLVGWGEPVVEGKAATVGAAVEEMSDFVIGHDARRIEDLWQVLYRGGFYRGGPVLMSAISGIDQALWDIKGKALGVPVYELLGGAVREKIRVYAWIGGDRPADVAREALAKKEQGYTAIKMNGTHEVEWIGSSARITEAVERAAAIREACGPDFGLRSISTGACTKARRSC
jgi:galactonate dehydratase